MTGVLAADLLMGPALEVRGLSADFTEDRKVVRALDHVSLTVAGGDILAVVGESGSGKSVLLQSILGLVRGSPGVVGGEVILRFRDGTEARPYLDLEAHLRRHPTRTGRSPDSDPERVSFSRRWRALVERRLRPLRGRRVGLVLQNGRAALDPFYTVGQQLVSVVVHDRPHAKAEHWLERLGFSDPAAVMKLYPHELSGGMAQRVMLGLVLAQEPELLLLDEITTGLDVSLQASVLELLARLYQEVGFSAVLVTHDLGIARSLSSKVLIMRHGRVEQEADTDDLFDQRVPLTPYADRLLRHGHAPAVAESPPTQPGGEAGTEAWLTESPRVEAEGVNKTFGAGGWLGSARRDVLCEVTVAVDVGECLALVGESGSGKTTLTRVLSGLTRADGGRVLWNGHRLGHLSRAAAAGFRRQRTVLFQNPYTSLNPAMTGRAAVAESLTTDLGLAWPVALEEAEQRLAVVGLRERVDQPLGRLSGGERRRVGLLIALQSPGELLVLDEPTAGLDAEHRTGVRRLIRSARAQQPQRTILLVSHDLGFVVGTADRILVLYRGRLVEAAAARDFLDPEEPRHPYTQQLWDASRYVAGAMVSFSLVPGVLDALGRLGTYPSPRKSDAETARGCVFRARCPIYQSDSVRWSICERETPVLQGLPARRRIACHGVRDAELDT